MYGTFKSISPSPACHLQIVPAYEDYEYVQDGDIIIGGVFTVNCLMAGYKIPEKPNLTKIFCMKPMQHYYKNIQMFLFAIDQMNKNPTILPNVTLGYHLYDSCSDPRKAIKSVLQILSGPGETIPNYSCRDHQELAGFIGDQSLTTTLPIYQLLFVYNYMHVRNIYQTPEIIHLTELQILCIARWNMWLMLYKFCTHLRIILVLKVRQMMKENIDTRFQNLSAQKVVSQDTGMFPALPYTLVVIVVSCVHMEKYQILQIMPMKYYYRENCMKCPDHEWPNENRTRCIHKEVEYLSFTDDTLSLVFITFSLLYFGKTLLVLIIFILHQDTPVVKANNKSLSFVLLVSIMLGFLCVFLGRPVDVTCLLRQISFGILFTIAVSSVLAKTIMVCIAFKATKPNSVWRKWIGVKLPTCTVLACSNVQVIICISWLSISPPFQELDTHSYQEKIIIQCNEGSAIGFYSVLGYMGILAAVSFIIAFFARTLPDSFNEAKYITFSMLVFCSVWIAMIPAYLSTKGKYTVAVEIFAILISNNGLLYCIFLTKCFIILFRPELNTNAYMHSQRNI
ncbi:vomeronasal type-2 receptor 26-like [Aquarana catesbeiana]|uniref:vomeronasal type-2 receptor 26-like n=1 Tax=Aquarana catesbeiana TaxID=8400 RepID=UPI003CCA5FE3